MNKLKGFEKKYLRGLAHGMKPVVLVGQKGLTDELIKSTNQALDTHELIKIKFIEFKETGEKMGFEMKSAPLVRSSFQLQE